MRKKSSSAMIEDLQRFLQREGSNRGPIDGKLGKRTMQAAEAYQIKNGIASGLLTYETLELMGLHVQKK
jgi:peptidoglycan hydrolase-like protein with peptidoglycan-binding domain